MPRGGIPGLQEKHGYGYAIAANKPIYGTTDAGRRFYKTFRRVAAKIRLQESRYCKSLYSYVKDGKIVILAGANVDDVMWAADPKYEYLIEQLLKEFQLSFYNTDQSRFCGRDYVQHDDNSVYVTCKHNTE